MGGSGIRWTICKSAPSCGQITTPAPHPPLSASRIIIFSNWLRLQELTQDKDELQKKVCDQLKQLSQLRSQMSDLVTLSSAAGHLVVDVERPAGVDEQSVGVDELSRTLAVRDKEVEHISHTTDILNIH